MITKLPTLDTTTSPTKSNTYLLGFQSDIWQINVGSDPAQCVVVDNPSIMENIENKHKCAHTREKDLDITYLQTLSSNSDSLNILICILLINAYLLSLHTLLSNYSTLSLYMLTHSHSTPSLPSSPHPPYTCLHTLIPHPPSALIGQSVQLNTLPALWLVNLNELMLLLKWAYMQPWWNSKENQNWHTQTHLHSPF